MLIDIKSSYRFKLYRITKGIPIARILATRSNVYVQSVFFMYTCTYVHNVRFDLLLRADIYIYILTEKSDPDIARNGPINPAVVRPEKFAFPPSTFSGDFRFVYSFKLNYSTTRVFFFFLLIRYFITK